MGIICARKPPCGPNALRLAVTVQLNALGPFGARGIADWACDACTPVAFSSLSAGAALKSAYGVGTAICISAVHQYADGAYTTVTFRALVICSTTFVYTHASRAMTAW